MTPEQYDDLLTDIRVARRAFDRARREAAKLQRDLDTLLDRLDREETRIAHEALYPEHSASRKLVIHE